MKRLVPTIDAYRLLHEGTIALAEVEAAGVRVDKAYLERSMVDCDAKILDYERQIHADKDYRIWHRKYGDKTNIASPEQLASVVFGDLGFKSKGKTATGKRDAADESAFVGVDLPLVKHYFAAAKLRKNRDTYLTGIRREMVQHHDDKCWYVHPNYNLNTVATFRSSCNDPNWTNIPARNPEAAEMIRRCYIPRIGRQMVELDYGQIEVRIPCCYNFDPTLISYVCDPTKDMHRDMAMQIFFLNEKQGKQKNIRHIAKNQFVFPTFYGSYYAQCAPNIWESIQGITLDGTDPPLTLIDHLKANGIHSLGACDPKEDSKPGTFEHHLKKIEEHFWGTRFKVYAQWKRDWYDAYQRDGGFMMLTGFAVTTPLDRKQVCNYPVQGVAFHLNLWSVIQIVKLLRRYKMQSLLIGEIHDCNNGDVLPRERNAYIDLCHDVMTEKVKQWAPWLNVPLTVEPEACPIDQPWFCKAALAKRDGTWVPDNMEKWTKQYGPWSN